MQNIIEATRKAYTSNFPYSQEDCIEIISYFLAQYRYYRHAEHPPLTEKQIQTLVRKLPWYSAKHGEYVDIAPEEYEEIIDEFFDINADGDIFAFFKSRKRIVKRLIRGEIERMWYL